MRRTPTRPSMASTEVEENVKSALATALTSDSAMRRLAHGDWYNKKRLRAERHHQSSSSSSAPLVRQVPAQPMCTQCGKGKFGSYCLRKMCRPCCIKEGWVRSSAGSTGSERPRTCLPCLSVLFGLKVPAADCSTVSSEVRNANRCSIIHQT